MSSEMSKPNKKQADIFEEAGSFHKELIKAGKEYEQSHQKARGTYNSTWHTSVDDKTMKDPDGRISRVSSHRTEMSASYSHKQESSCVIQ
ncbi:hypothetical protein RRG08_015339 [Elysia crispata]|uniref:Uncharacterized protein n=1 Tax=Elysia crispata TaxID=231223 RepID=A0AAE1DU32_9GAST|nr:hypothetical protein RRG08_015339 [Elysia crispata]